MNKKFKIIIIDDTPENLKLLIEILKDKDYDIRVFPNTKLAMKAMERDKPDLILLDINMLETTGFEFANYLKHNAVFRDIPIIFITASNSVEDKVRAFELGGTDYITKPFQVEEVLARVAHQIRLNEAKNELEDTLSNTLNGAVSLLTDILSMLNPEVFNRSLRLKAYTKLILQNLHLRNRWIYEISAMLSHIGCIDIPQKIFKKRVLDIPMTNDEIDLYNRYKILSSQLISRIPRLELVSIIVKEDFSELKNEIYCNCDKEIIKNGIEILKLVKDYDNLVCQQLSIDEIEIRMKEKSFLYNKDFLNALLAESHLLSENYINRKINLKNIKPGMLVLEDITTTRGIKILGKNTMLTENLVYLIKLYAEKHDVKEEILVSYIPTK